MRTLAGWRLQPPAGKTFIFFLSMTSKDGVMSGGWRGGGCRGVGGQSGQCLSGDR